MPFDNSHSAPLLILVVLALGLAALTYRIADKGPTYFSVSGWVVLAVLSIGFANFAKSFAERPLRMPASAVARQDANPVKLSLDRSQRMPQAILDMHQRRTEGYRTIATLAWIAFGVAIALGYAGGYGARRRRIRSGGAAPVKVADIQGFVDMLATACEDAGMQGTLEKLLSLPDAQRHELLTQIIQEMRERRAPKDIVDAFICLQDDAIAEKAYEAVYKCPRGVPISPLQPLRTAA